MKVLEKNSGHSNNIFLYRDFTNNDLQCDSYYKASSSVAGIECIKRDMDGLAWYTDSLNLDYAPEVVLETDKYIKVKYPCIQGQISKTSGGYLLNTEQIERVIKQYITLWSPFSSASSAPVHGDLSYEGNIIFTIDGPFIIDWEHFKASGAPIGFDALYFLFEFILLFYKGGYPGDRVMQHIVLMIAKLKKHGCIADEFKSNKLRSILDYIAQDQNIWGNQKFKIPLKHANYSAIEKIDGYINEKIPARS